MTKRLLFVLAVLFLTLGLDDFEVLGVSSHTATSDIPFEYVVIDNQELGIRAIGDIDGDGFADIVVRIETDGMRLAWYEYPGWNQHVITDQANFRSDDIELADIDDDADLDIVAVIDEPGKVYWFENPRPMGNATDMWTSHYVDVTDGGSDNQYVKDIEISDFDGDEKLDIVARTHRTVFVFQQDTPTSWTAIQVIGIHDHEGMDVGDLDQDGDPDVALNGFWLENPDDPVNGTWVEHNIDAKWWSQDTSDWTDNNCKVHVADMNEDGRTDVLLSHSEKPGYPVSWYEASDPKNGPWTEHVIDYVDYAHTLKAADMDNDGDLDVVTAEMPKSSDPDQVIVFVNAGDSLTWTRQVIATTGNYSAMLGDIGADGDIDIVGGRNWDSAPIELWENKSASPLDNWTYVQVDDSRAARAFGLALGDLTGDGYGDIVSGPYFYRNPGGDMTGTWSRIPLPNDVDAQLIVDVDGDALADVIAEDLPAVYWLEATDLQDSSWNAIQIGTLPENSHQNGQGYALAQIVAGGPPEIILPGDIYGIFYFEIPTNPSAGNWPRTQITDQANDEGIGVGDIDADGDIDIAAGHDAADGPKVAWWENPGDGTGSWTQHVIGSSSNWPDRFAVADINGDGRLDIVMSEETPLEDARVYWFEQPTDPTNPHWTRHTLVTQYTTNSLDVADMDQDGDIDIITGEHRGTEKVAIWENVHSGYVWKEHVVSVGRESHLGARVADLDGDGDLEIVSIAWDDYQHLHLWRNDAREMAVGRVTDGLQVLYDFKEGSGSKVHDVSGNGTPLHLSIENGSATNWLLGRGLAIDSATMVASLGAATKIISACQDTNEISVEAWIKPANTTQDGPAHIVTLSSDGSNRNFTLGQDGDAYDIRLRTTATSDNGIPSLAAPDGSAGTQLTHVVYTRDAAGLVKVYINGVEQASGTVGGDFSNWDDSFRLALANELTQDHPWSGELYLVAVFNRALSQTQVSQNFNVGLTRRMVPFIWLPLILKWF